MGNEVIKTYFNGAVTQEQLIGIIIAAVAVVLILSFVKKVAKLILTIVVVIIAAVYFGIMSPSQVQDLANVIQEKGADVFESIAAISNCVDVSTGENGEISVNIKIGDKWYSTDSIDSFIKADDGTYTVIIGENSFSISDEGIKRVLDLLKK